MPKCPTPFDVIDFRARFPFPTFSHFPCSRNPAPLPYILSSFGIRLHRVSNLLVGVSVAPAVVLAVALLEVLPLRVQLGVTDGRGRRQCDGGGAEDREEDQLGIHRESDRTKLWKEFTTSA